MKNDKNTPENSSENLLNIKVPKKFLDSKTGEIKLDLLVKSYNELEKHLSKMPKRPKTPKDYCIDCSHGLFEADEEINQRLYDKGFTQEQAQEVYDLAAERMVPMICEIHADYKADAEIEKLISHFGGVDQWKEVSRQLLSFGRKNLPEDVLDNLSSSYEGVIALYRMMKGNEPSLQRGNGEVIGNIDSAKLSSMMRDPKYWREKDPAYVAKVTQAFQHLYGEKY